MKFIFQIQNISNIFVFDKVAVPFKKLYIKTFHSSEVAIKDIEARIYKKKDDNDVPKDDNDVPIDDNDVPIDDNDVPKDDNDRPKDDNDVPKDDKVSVHKVVKNRRAMTYW